MANTEDPGDVETGNRPTTGADSRAVPPAVLEQARLGNRDLFRTKLESGNHPLDFNAGRDMYFNRTPLHLAAMEGHEEIVEFILSHPKISTEVVNAKDCFGYTPLHLAVRHSHKNVVRLLVMSSWVLPDIFLAATSERDEIGSDSGGCTPLHLAALGGLTAIAKLLLRQPRRVEFACDPVNIFAMTWLGYTALDIARLKNFGDLVDFLEASDLNWLLLERERCAISANAVLVGAALVAAATFATWMQPPGGIPAPDSEASGAPTSSPSASSSSSRSDRRLNSYFYLFVAFAFAYSVASLALGILATFPFRKASLRFDLRMLRLALRYARSCLLLALVFVIFAFSIAGWIVFDKVASTQSVVDKFIQLLVVVFPIVACGMVVMWHLFWE